MNGLSTFYYSVIRAVPNPEREESINLGVMLLAADGSYADLASVPANRVQVLDPKADVGSVQLFLDGLLSRLPLDRQQVKLPGAETSIDVATLESWSREFGGMVRVSQPRVTLGQSPTRVLDDLFRDLVAPLRPERQKRPSVIDRAEILAHVDSAIASWNVDPQLVVPERTWPGAKADHLIDRVVLRPDARYLALLHAVNFQAAHPADAYGARGSLIVATDDLRARAESQSVLSFAVYADAPKDREHLVIESASLFNDHQILAVNYRDLSSIRTHVGAVLHI